MKILVTGGAGYIGSHACVELLDAGHEVVVVDSLVNSCKEALNRVEQISGKQLSFYQIDVCDDEALDSVFQQHRFNAVIHFAGLKAVGESVEQPLHYYENNIHGAIVLARVMERHGVRDIVFSSSATVYGDPANVPVKEDFPLSCTNPYGHSKLFIEQILRDLHVADSRWNVVLLRYFNPVGAHASGLIGEDPEGIPNNLMPYISQVAVGKLEELQIFGSDYDTHDGTGVRDFIHVVDLAQGHVSAVEKLADKPGAVVYNLGTGEGYSVIDMVKAFEKASGKTIPYKLVERRPGDVAITYADPSLAYEELGWKASRGLEEMTRDSWNWQSKNPSGYMAED
jgi:UDP-glucose 4-epimerase